MAEHSTVWAHRCHIRYSGHSNLAVRATIPTDQERKILVVLVNRGRVNGTAGAYRCVQVHRICHAGCSNSAKCYDSLNDVLHYTPRPENPQLDKYGLYNASSS
jgi:hypothetical protein